MARLSGKVAVITGGSSGIGLATAKAFVAEGAEVVMTGRREDRLRKAVLALGHRAHGIGGDVGDRAHQQAIADFVSDRFGGLDIYMANAGVNTIAASEAVSEEEYDAQFDTNAKGAFFGFQAIRPLLRDGASVILTSSVAAEKRLDGHAVYAGSKAALRAFAEAWAIELSARRIRVNLLSPGPVDTEILGKLGISSENRPAFEETMAEAVPLGRMAQPEELAEAALFLASDAASFINGVNLRADGGMSIR